MYNAYLFMNLDTGEATRIAHHISYQEAISLCKNAMQALIETGLQIEQPLHDNGWYEMPGWLPRACVYDAAHDMLELWKGRDG